MPRYEVRTLDRDEDCVATDRWRRSDCLALYRSRIEQPDRRRGDDITADHVVREVHRQRERFGSSDDDATWISE